RHREAPSRTKGGDAQGRSCRNRRRNKPKVTPKTSKLDPSWKGREWLGNKGEQQNKQTDDPLTTPARSAGGRRGQNR
ncbi:unnamed protein product, partial [Arabidopsis halleri]